MRPKEIIIDKTVFRAASASKLEGFVQNHFVILPDVLYYECVTADKNREVLLDRFRDVVFAGGYICPSRNIIIQKEAENLSPYGPLVDMQTISAVRQTFQQNRTPYNPKDVETAYRNELEMAQMIMDLADGFTQKMASEQPELLSEIRKCDSSKAGRSERLVEWAQFVDSQDIHRASEEVLKGLTNRPDEFCLSDEWVSWHFLRLILILSMERTFLRHTGDASGRISIEHDLQDITYVLLLSRADGLLTGDKGCSCLARVAFPEKDVFSGLHEVPEEYLGGWT
jgi:hypothetical protein